MLLFIFSSVLAIFTLVRPKPKWKKQLLSHRTPDYPSFRRHLGCLHRFLRVAVHIFRHRPTAADAIPVARFFLLKEPILLYKKIIPQTRKFDLPLSTGSYHFYMKGCLRWFHKKSQSMKEWIRAVNFTSCDFSRDAILWNLTCWIHRVSPWIHAGPERNLRW